MEHHAVSSHSTEGEREREGEGEMGGKMKGKVQSVEEQCSTVEPVQLNDR